MHVHPPTYLRTQDAAPQISLLSFFLSFPLLFHGKKHFRRRPRTIEIHEGRWSVFLFYGSHPWTDGRAANCPHARKRRKKKDPTTQNIIFTATTRTQIHKRERENRRANLLNAFCHVSPSLLPTQSKTAHIFSPQKNVVEEKGSTFLPQHHGNTSFFVFPRARERERKRSPS